MIPISDVKQALRIKTNAFDTEMQDLILSAESDLKLSGILKSKIVETDSLIKRAVILYTKANFGLNNADSEKYQASYDSLKTHLCLSQEYTVEVT